MPIVRKNMKISVATDPSRFPDYWDIPHRRKMGPKKKERQQRIAHYRVRGWSPTGPRSEGLIWYHASTTALLETRIALREYRRVALCLSYLDDMGRIRSDAPLPMMLRFLSAKVRRDGKSAVMAQQRMHIQGLLREARKMHESSLAAEFRLP